LQKNIGLAVDSFVVPINKELHTNVVSFHTFYAKFALKQILSFLETATA
jgi:hypothetical protein